MLPGNAPRALRAALEAYLAEREQALSATCEQRAHLAAAMAELPGVEADAQQARDHSYEVMSAFIATQAPRLAALGSRDPRQGAGTPAPRAA